MKKILSILFIITSLYSKGQTTWTPVDTFGTWGYQSATTTNFNTFNAYGVEGYHVLFNWKDVKPTYAGAYNWSSVDNLVDSAIARGKWIGFMASVGQNSPTWVLDSAGSYSTEGGALTGPWPRYYNINGYQKFYFQFLKDVVAHIASYSTARKEHCLYLQIAEGSTGDEQPYKGVLDACQVDASCTHSDSIANNGALGDPLVPQDKFENKWDEFRKAAWDTIAKSSEYTSVNTWFHLMFNSGNNGTDLDYVYGDSTESSVEDDWYIDGHFGFLPLQPFIKEGQMSHVYSFRGERSYYNRITPASRGEIQGQLKVNRVYSKKDLFFLMASALTGGLSMMNIDQAWPPVVTGGTPRSLTDFFTKYTNSKSEGFSIPTLRVDVLDTITYPTNTFGPLIDTSALGQKKYNTAIYNYNKLAASTGYNAVYVEWQYIRVVDKNKNIHRSDAIATLMPTATHGNQTDSIYYNDYVTGAAQNYGKNLRQLRTATTVVPQFRVGKDTASLGRFAGKPKLVDNQCSWYYDINNELINDLTTDTVEITIAYLDNASGGSISISCIECGEKVTKGTATTVSTNTGDWKYKIVTIPAFQFKPNSYDFMLDFTGNVTIGMVQVHNLSKH